MFSFYFFSELNQNHGHRKVPDGRFAFKKGGYPNPSPPLPMFTSISPFFVHRSDALSAPLSFLPAEAGDLSLLSLALPQLNSGSGGSHVTSMAQCQPSSSVGICKDGGGRGNGNSGEKGDTGWLYIAEDRGYLCVDLLLGRTLRELAEGLAFAARCAG